MSNRLAAPAPSSSFIGNLARSTTGNSSGGISAPSVQQSDQEMLQAFLDRHHGGVNPPLSRSNQLRFSVRHERERRMIYDGGLHRILDLDEEDE